MDFLSSPVLEFSIISLLAIKGCIAEDFSEWKDYWYSRNQFENWFMCSDDSLLSYYIIWHFKFVPAFQRNMLRHLLGDWIQFFVETKVNGRIKSVDYIGRLKGLWPMRAREMEERMDLVQSQWDLEWNQFKRPPLKKFSYLRRQNNLVPNYF